jgi:hypothetical protein
MPSGGCIGPGTHLTRTWRASQASQRTCRGDQKRAQKYPPRYITGSKMASGILNPGDSLSRHLPLRRQGACPAPRYAERWLAARHIRNHAVLPSGILSPEVTNHIATVNTDRRVALSGSNCGLLQCAIPGAPGAPAGPASPLPQPCRAAQARSVQLPSDGPGRAAKPVTRAKLSSRAPSERDSYPDQVLVERVPPTDTHT